MPNKTNLISVNGNCFVRIDSNQDIANVRLQQTVNNKQPATTVIITNSCKVSKDNVMAHVLVTVAVNTAVNQFAGASMVNFFLQVQVLLQCFLPTIIQHSTNKPLVSAFTLGRYDTSQYGNAPQQRTVSIQQCATSLQQ